MAGCFPWNAFPWKALLPAAMIESTHPPKGYTFSENRRTSSPFHVVYPFHCECSSGVRGPCRNKTPTFLNLESIISRRAFKSIFVLSSTLVAALKSNWSYDVLHRLNVAVETANRSPLTSKKRDRTKLKVLSKGSKTSYSDITEEMNPRNKKGVPGGRINSYVQHLGESANAAATSGFKEVPENPFIEKDAFVICIGTSPVPL